MTRGFVDLSSDFSQIAELIGSAEAVADEMDTPYYTEDIIKAAHAVAAKEFDTETAVIAASTKTLNHMYEWGTAGINPAPNTPRLSPTSQAAKLWIHRLTGRGKSRSIDFEFKPSVVPVPLPTPRTSGVRAGAVNKWPTRRYTFAARPWITETGTTVIIKPKYAKALFIPFNGAPFSYADENSKNRGYIMTRNAVKSTPGKTLAGNFTKHWYGWWNSEGRSVINETAEHIVEGDIKAVVRTRSGGTRALRSLKGGVSTKTFSLQVSTARAAAKALIRTASKDRVAAAEMKENLNAMGGLL